MKPIHHLQSQDVEIRLAGRDGLQIELRGETLDQFQKLWNRSLNTSDPHKTPSWCIWLADKLNGDKL